MIEWAGDGELLAAYMLAIGAACLIGGLIALFNSWRA